MFIETLLVYCFIKQDQHFTDDEIKDINHNDSIVATKGREPNLTLVKDGITIGLNEWGRQIIENLFPIAAELDSDEKQYTMAVEQMWEKVRDANLTMSGRLLDQVLSENMSFIDLGNSIGESNRTHYLNISKSKNDNWDLFEKEAIDSHNQQEILEKDSGESFKTFVEKRFKY